MELTVADFKKLQQKERKDVLNDLDDNAKRRNASTKFITGFNSTDLEHRLPELDATGMFEESNFNKNKKEKND